MLYEQLFKWLTRKNRCDHSFDKREVSKTSWDGCFTTTKIILVCNICGKKKKTKHYDLVEHSNYIYR